MICLPVVLQYYRALSVVETNNEIKSLIIREQQEIERILMELTDCEIESPSKCGDRLTLDFIFAKAKLSRSELPVPNCPVLRF